MRLKLKTFFGVVTIMLVWAACRKMDKEVENVMNRTNKYTKFFNGYAPVDASVAAIAAYVRRENEKYHFTDKVVAQLGYPRWDKASIISPKHKVSHLDNEPDSTISYWVPFVRENENFVNASLVINTTAGDTTQYFTCDWQYKNRVHGSPMIDTTAEATALFFMRMDYQTFGHGEFTITDTLLFGSFAGTGQQPRVIIKEEAPTEVTGNICIQTVICGTPNTWCANGCDFLNCAGTPGTSNWCAVYGELCESDPQAPPGGSGGGTGAGTGTGTGGTGSGGGSTWTPPPPNCTPPILSEDVTNPPPPCPPGWIPTSGVANNTYVLNNMVIIPPDEPPLDMNEYLKCFTNTPGSVYKITITADQPVPGQSDCWGYDSDGDIDVGHTFITLEQIKPDGSKITRSFGFHPTTSPVKPLSPTSPGGFYIDTSYNSDASLTTTSTSGSTFMMNINILKTMTVPQYHLSLLNCTTVATYIYTSFTGTTIPLQSCFWATSGNPGDLGQYIRNMQLGPDQTRNTQTAKPSPEAGGC